MAKSLKKITKNVKEAGFDKFLYRNRDTKAPEPQDIEFLAKELSEISTYGVSDLNGLTGEVDLVEGEAIDLTVTAASNTITIAAEEATYTNLGVASFATADFDVTNGAVELEDTVVKTVASDSGSATPSTHGFTIAGGEGIDTSGTGSTITIAGEDATTTNKGIASFDTNHFTVTSGAVSIKEDGIDDTLIDWGTGANQVSAVDVPIADAGSYYTGTEVETALQEAMTELKVHKLTGFEDDSTVALSTDAGNPPEITLTFTGTVYWWSDGVRYSDSGTDSLTIADTTGLHYIYYDGATLSEAVNPSHNDIDSVIVNKAVVMIVYWNATDNAAYILARETHGVIMSGETHHWIHDNVGARYKSGLTMSDYVLNTATDAALTFQVSDGEFYDEDLEFEIEDGTATNQYEQQLSGGDAEIPVLYRDNAGVWSEQAASTLPYIVDGSNDLQYMDADNSYTQTTLGNSKFMIQWLIATNDWQYPVKMIQGTTEYNTKALALEGASSEVIDWGSLPSAEFIVLYQLILQQATGTSVNGKIIEVIDYRYAGITGASATSQDHGSLSGLADDDHAQYLLADGTRDLTGTWTVSTDDITLTAGTLTASSITDGTATITGGSASSLGYDMASNTLTGTMAEFDTACSDGDFAYSGGAFHDGFSDFVANEHIDWTNASSNFLTSGNATVQGLLILDDGVGDSPPARFIGGTNNDTINILLRDDGTAGYSDLAVELADGGGESQFQIRDSGSSTVAYVDSDGGAMFGGSMTIGSGAAGVDYTLTFNGQDADGVITWDEDNDQFIISDDTQIAAGEKLYFRDLDIYLTCASDGELSIAADSKIIMTAGTAIEINSTLDLEDNAIEDVKSLVFNDGGSTVDIIRDEDDMASDDDAALATQQSIKAYVDNNAGGAALTVKEGGVQVGDADIEVLDFDGDDFNLTEDPDKEINITVNDGGIDHDSTANFVANEHIDWTSTASNFDTSGTVGTGEITVADGASINLQEAITFTGATTENLIEFPDNLAAGLIITEGANPYLTFTSTDAGEKMEAGVKLDMGDNEIEDVKSLAFNDGGATVTEVKDEDDMASDSATVLATQQSIKAYVDDQVLGGNSIYTDQSGGTGDTYGALTGNVDGANTDYTVSQAEYISGSLRVWLNGQLLTQGSSEDWVEDTPGSGTFDMNTAPETGDDITVEYMVAASASGNADTVDGIDFATLTSSIAELNILDGVTATAAELNILDGVTATYEELNITDGGSTAEKVLNTQCKCRAYLGSPQDNLTNNTVTLVNLDTETYDVGSDFNTTTHQFTAPVSGYYMVSAQISYTNSLVANTRYLAYIYVNGAAHTVGYNLAPYSDYLSVPINDIVYATSGQTIDLRARSISGNNNADLHDTTAATYMAIHLLSV